jgi:hypothetical protein
MRTIIGALSFPKSGPLDEPYPLRTGEDSSLRQADEQAVLHDTGHVGKAACQCRRIGDALQLRVEQPVPAIRDKSVAAAVAS